MFLSHISVKFGVGNVAPLDGLLREDLLRSPVWLGRRMMIQNEFGELIGG